MTRDPRQNPWPGDRLQAGEGVARVVVRVETREGYPSVWVTYAKHCEWSGAARPPHYRCSIDEWRRLANAPLPYPPYVAAPAQEPCTHGGRGRPLVVCAECGNDKAPLGRDVAAVCAGSYCDDECEGYFRRPRPSSLWPGEEPDPDLCRLCRCNLCLAADAPHAITVRGHPRWLCARCWRQREAGTRSLVILSGEPFDWGEGAEMARRVLHDDGEVNWGAAMRADPGVVSCPACGVYHWREGERVRCSMTDCAHEWDL